MSKVSMLAAFLLCAAGVSEAEWSGVGAPLCACGRPDKRAQGGQRLSSVLALDTFTGSLRRPGLGNLGGEMGRKGTTKRAFVDVAGLFVRGATVRKSVSELHRGKRNEMYHVHPVHGLHMEEGGWPMARWAKSGWRSMHRQSRRSLQGAGQTQNGAATRGKDSPGKLPFVAIRAIRSKGAQSIGVLLSNAEALTKSGIANLERFRDHMGPLVEEEVGKVLKRYIFLSQLPCAVLDVADEFMCCRADRELLGLKRGSQTEPSKPPVVMVMSGEWRTFLSEPCSGF